LGTSDLPEPYQHDYDVFFDYTGIASGDFERVILDNIRGRAHFLVLLTPSALERCNDPRDWLRREIEAALASRRNIVPLMLEGFDFAAPTIAGQITDTLAGLKQYHALRIPTDYFMEAMDRLRNRYLNVPLAAVLHPASPTAQRAAIEQQAAAQAAPTIPVEELTAQQWFERALAAADADEKLRFYTEAIRLKPDYADAFSNRGVVRYDRGDLEGAIEDLNQAIRLKPEYGAFFNRGEARCRQGDIEGAVKDYTEAIRLRPDYAAGFTNRGVVRYSNGDLEGAISDFTEAIRLKPEYGTFSNRAEARYRKGDVEGALKDYDEAIRLNPGEANIFSSRGVVRYSQQDVEGALEDYDEAIRLKPEFAEAFNNRGNLRRSKGNLAVC